MLSPLANAGKFLINTIFDIYITIVIIRFILGLARANFYNPVALVIVKATNPLLIPLRKIIPGFSGIDLASIFLLLILQAIKIILLTLVAYGTVMTFSTDNILGLLIFGCSDLIKQTITIYMFAIIMIVILSWIAHGTYNPVTELLASITNPLLLPIRRILPHMGGLDLSPIIAIILLQTTSYLVADSISYYGQNLITLK